MHVHPSILRLLLLVGCLSGTTARAADAPIYVEPTTLCFESAVAASAANLGYCDVAIEQLRDGSSSDPAQARELAAALSNRALIALREGNFDAASADLEEAFGIGGAGPELLLNRGNLRLAQRRYREALEDYDQALRLSGGRLTAAHYNSAFAHRAIGAVQDSVVDLLRTEGHEVEYVDAPAASAPR